MVKPKIKPVEHFSLTKRVPRRKHANFWLHYQIFNQPMFVDQFLVESNRLIIFYLLSVCLDEDMQLSAYIINFSVSLQLVINYW